MTDNYVIFTVILVIATVILAIATIFLAIATYNMANVSRKSFDLDSRPYFAFINFNFRFFLEKSSKNKEITATRIGLVFKNPGRVLIHYQVRSIHFTLAGSTIDNPQFENLGGYIYPNNETVFWYGTLPKTDISTMPIIGVGEYEIDYSGVGQEKLYTTKRKIKYTINSITPYACDWVFLEEFDN
jgi:hypothetical protein